MGYGIQLMGAACEGTRQGGARCQLALPARPARAHSQVLCAADERREGGKPGPEEDAQWRSCFVRALNHAAGAGGGAGTGLKAGCVAASGGGEGSSADASCAAAGTKDGDAAGGGGAASR